VLRIVAMARAQVFWGLVIKKCRGIIYDLGIGSVEGMGEPQFWYAMSGWIQV